MAESKDSALSRRLLYGTILVGILILCNLGLFGVLLFRSLSEKEISRILLETRSEAEQIALELAGEVERQGGDDLFTALVQEQETQTYIDRVLAKRQIVETVRIYDREGRKVFENIRERNESDADLSSSGISGGPGADGDLSQLDLAAPPLIETEVLHREVPYEVVEVPVGDVGSFVIGISRVELERRAGQLRADLIRSAAPIAVVTVVVLVGAYLFILFLVRRAKKLEGRAKEAEQLAYIGTLASGLAHEIRSPLNSLNLNMQMLEEEAVSNDRRSNHRLFAITRAEITRLENLVTDFLSYARPRPLALAKANAGDLLHELRESLAGQLRLGTVEIVVDDRTGGAEVAVDRDQMRQLLLNLVQNGIAAAEEAGRRPSVRLTAERQGNRVVLAVEDNGAGIPPELHRAGVRPLLFDAQGRDGPRPRHRPPHRPRPRRGARAGEHAGGGHPRPGFSAGRGRPGSGPKSAPALEREVGSGRASPSRGLIDAARRGSVCRSLRARWRPLEPRTTAIRTQSASAFRAERAAARTINERLLLESTMYAIIETGGKQYRVAAGDIIEIERVAKGDGDRVEFSRVLFVGGEGSVRTGTPALDGALVRGVAVSEFAVPRSACSSGRSARATAAPTVIART